MRKRNARESSKSKELELKQLSVNVSKELGVRKKSAKELKNKNVLDLQRLSARDKRMSVLSALDWKRSSARESSKSKELE